MSLTMPPGPLATHAPDTTNYTITGPRHRLLRTEFPRRVRAEFAGSTVFDTTGAALVHESNLLPALYVPADDVDTDLLTSSAHTTHCPFKGDASYWSITAGDRTADDAVWAYEQPIEDADWLQGWFGFYWDRLDHWFDEDEEVFGHLRDPFHRIDVRPSNRRVQVVVDGTLVAESSAAKVLSETGLPNRWYLPERDVRMDVLTQSDTSTHCPYKGQSTYWSTPTRPDIAWSYPEPFDDARRVAGHVCFDGDDVQVDVAAPG